MNTQNRKTSSKYIYKMILGIIPFLILFVMSSCEKDPSSLGANLLPDSDSLDIKYDTTLTFSSSVYKKNVFSTSNLSNYTLGIIDDPYFGKLTGEYAGQYLPVVLDENINSYTIDSLVLYLSVDSIYGNAKESVSFNVYELTSEITEDSSHYSNEDISHLYSEANKINTSCEIRGDSLIAITLSSDFAAKLKSNASFYESDSTFKLAFKGISIIPSLSSGLGGTYYVNITSSNSKISFYYHTATEDSLSIGYLFSYGHRYANYSTDYSSAIINDYLTNPENENDDLLFIQDLSGFSSKITLSNYKSVFDKNSSYSILNAELIIPVFKDNNFETFSPPNNLYFLYATEDSSLYSVADYNAGMFDGSYNSENSEYRFNISKHFEKMLKGEVTDSCLNFNIVPRYSSNGLRLLSYGHRVILKSGDIKMKVTYTKH